MLDVEGGLSQKDTAIVFRNTMTGESASTVTDPGQQSGYRILTNHNAGPPSFIFLPPELGCPNLHVLS